MSALRSYNEQMARYRATERRELLARILLGICESVAFTLFVVSCVAVATLP